MYARWRCEPELIVLYRRIVRRYERREERAEIQERQNDRPRHRRTIATQLPPDNCRGRAWRRYRIRRPRERCGMGLGVPLGHLGGETRKVLIRAAEGREKLHR